jgi:pimeloyl-ACP methyl ester carboxylesterase
MSQSKALRLREGDPSRQHLIEAFIGLYATCLPKPIGLDCAPGQAASPDLGVAVRDPQGDASRASSVEAEGSTASEVALARYLDHLRREGGMSPAAATPAQPGASPPTLSPFQPVRAADGQILRTYVWNAEGETDVVVVLPMGMPAILIEGWVDALKGGSRVITWETRGLFDPPFDKHLDCSLETQLSDLHQVCRHYDVRNCHLMGFCGGAVVALAGAGLDCVHSLSLWHGDYHFPDGECRTEHQQDFDALVSLARVGLEQASETRQLMMFPQVAKALPREKGCFLLYPYLHDLQFHLYARLAHTLAEADAGRLAARVDKPALVATSAKDTTASPEGSRRVARNLPAGRIFESRTNQHLDVFDAPLDLRRALTEFLAEIG